MGLSPRRDYDSLVLRTPPRGRSGSVRSSSWDQARALLLLSCVCLCGRAEAEDVQSDRGVSLDQGAESAPSLGRFRRWFRSKKGARTRDIASPGPDLANFPDSSFTLPRHAFYLEASPLTLASASDVTPLNYSADTLLRFGITDNIEARLFTGGLAVYVQDGVRRVGLLPLAFDTKLHLTEHAFQRFNFSLGLEVYVQTPWGSSAFSSGVQYSVNLLVDHALPWQLAFEWNLGFVHTTDDAGNPVMVPTFQAALQRPIFESLSLFLQSYRNAATLPRTALNRGNHSGRERATVYGVGLQWTLNPHWALFGAFNVGHGGLAPRLSGSAGFAVSL